MLPNALFHSIVFFSLLSANDNDMTMDEGMAFTIGKLHFTIFMSTKVPLCMSVGLLLSVNL